VSLFPKQRKKSGRQFSVAAKILAFRIYRLNLPTFRSVPPDRIPVTTTLSPGHSFSPACDDTTEARFLSQPQWRSPNCNPGP
jgi:hypothetical protein